MKRFIIWANLILIVLLPKINLRIQQDIPHKLPSILAFYTDSSDSPNDLLYVDPQTLEMRKVLHFDIGQNPQDVKWSPDGQYMAVVQRVAPYQSRIIIYTVEGDEIKHLDVALWKPDFYRFPIEWNSDGKYLSILTKTENDLPQLGVINVQNDPLNTSQGVSLEAEELERIYWSPTGEYMAYQTSPIEQINIPATSPQPLLLYLLNVKTGEANLLTDQSYDNCVTWSNNGDRLGIVSNLTRDQRSGLLTADGLTIWDLTGQVAEKIIPYRYKTHFVMGCPFSWSHDDSYVAFSSQYFEDNNVKGGLFIARANHSEAELLTGTSYGVLNIALSPDNTYLAVDTLYGAFRDVRVISLDGWQHTYTIKGVPFFNSSWQPLVMIPAP